jgi:glycosyltransferase involved in cell wall biosynthesis
MSDTISTQVSAAVATLDRPDGLARFLDHLLHGEMLPAEVIIVDQGQDARIKDLILAHQNPRVPLVYLHQPCRGLSYSRNAAISCARSPIIAFSDDDCVPHFSWVKSIERVFAARPEIAAASGRVLPYGKETPGTFTVSTRTSTQPANYWGKSLPWDAGTGGNLAVRREWLHQAGGFDIRLGTGSAGLAGEDAEFVYRLLGLGAVVRYEPELLIYHERQSIERRLASRYGYGHGIGAFSGLTLKRRDPYAFFILYVWFRHWLTKTARCQLRMDRHGLGEQKRGLQGFLGGLRYGFALQPGLDQGTGS